MKQEATDAIYESKRQRDCLKEIRKIVEKQSDEWGHPLKYMVKTFGCQMNARDSEKLSGMLDEAGFVPSETEDCDFVIYNTCTVRENANNKVYGRLGYLHGFKKKNPSMKIALCGCMMQEEAVVERIEKSYPFVDLVFGTHNLYRFPELLLACLESGGQIIDIWKEHGQIVEDLPVRRKYFFKSGVNIMFGCNNFCSYCIVPYVRGRERSRNPKDIIEECKKLVADGVVEIMLLGQNVNSYGNTLQHNISFSELLNDVSNIPGLRRIRFMTSHPKDLSDGLINTMASHENICPHMHLPLQSGSDRILKAMNRHYTKERYLELVASLRDRMPDISITTDIIVGFPGENEEDFMETMDVVKKVEFDSAFTFIYSKRSGTPASKSTEIVPEEVVKTRFNRLLQEVQSIGARRSTRFEGEVQEVLVEQINPQDPSLVTGRLSNNMVVHFPGTKEMIGAFERVRLSECHGFYFIGERA